MGEYQVVLLGQIGSGKTSLYNRITYPKQKTSNKWGNESCTQNVYSRSSAYGNYPFRILDTPGFGASNKKIDRVAGIMAAFTQGPVNRIILVAKLERLDGMEMILTPIIAPFSRYRNKMTLLVTHWDQQDNNEQEVDKNYIQNRFKKQFNIKSFIFSSKNDSGANLCDKILNELRYSRSRQVDLLESDYLKFDLHEFTDDLEMEIYEWREHLLVSFKKQEIEIRKFIEKYPSISPNLNDVMYALTLEVKTLAEKTLEKFEKDNWELINKLIEGYGESMIYQLHTILKKEMESNVSYICRLAQEKLRSQKNHCFNFIKKCPYCGQIWMKDYSCNSDTYCGEIRDQISSPPQKWTLIWKGDQIQDIQFTDKQLPQKHIGHIGCGNQIIWEMMIHLTEGEVNELLNPGIQDYYCEQDETIQKRFENSKNLFTAQLKQAIERQKATIVSE